MTTAMSDQATEQARADDFNRAHPVGTYVRYWTGVREGDGKVSATRTAAQVLGWYTAVVWVEGVASCIALTHVELLSDQPDGIEDDSRDLPDPVAAAERVREYICQSGDGLYDVQGGAPLYARDLEAIVRAVLAAAADQADAEAGRACPNCAPGYDCQRGVYTPA